MLLNRWSCSVPGGEKTLIDCFRLRSVCHLPSLGPSQPGTGPVKQRHLFSQSDTYAWTWNLRLSLFTIICPINDSVWLQMRKYTVDYLTDEEEHSSVRTLISVSGSGSFDLICICICIFFWLSLWSTAGGMRFCCAFVYTHTHTHTVKSSHLSWLDFSASLTPAAHLIVSATGNTLVISPLAGRLLSACWCGPFVYFCPPAWLILFLSPSPESLRPPSSSPSATLPSSLWHLWHLCHQPKDPLWILHVTLACASIQASALTI